MIKRRKEQLIDKERKISESLELKTGLHRYTRFRHTENAAIIYQTNAKLTAYYYGKNNEEQSLSEEKTSKSLPVCILA